ncbi:hypothetical protein [Marinobacter santoriniensis]|uniref:hypothetical protein n=1 Tax=Marinobacter santoriniensis TaxID=523742 RepID=UPI0009FFD3B4|nr:hypothetical protein [Marinobacter santoriniensis]
MIKNIANSYRGGTVQLDNNSFTACTFDNCALEFGGTGPVELNECSFNNVQWIFTGAAKNTLNFLHGMYSGMGEGGRQIVEATFDNIRGKNTTNSGKDRL